MEDSRMSIRLQELEEENRRLRDLLEEIDRWGIAGLENRIKGALGGK